MSARQGATRRSAACAPALARLTLCLALSLAVIPVMPSATVEAHAYYFKSEPPREEVLSAAPSQVKVWFTEDVAAKYSWLRVLDSAGNRVDSGDLQTDPNDATLLILALPPLGPGVYTVQWRTVSADDGHEAENEFHFTVTG